MQRAKKWRNVVLLAAAALSIACGRRPTSKTGTDVPTHAQDTWQREGDQWTSPGWRSAKMGADYDVGARLPSRADGVLEVGIGQSPDYMLQLRPEGARSVALEEDQGRAIYREAYPFTDALFTATAQRVEWSLLLRTADALTEFSWRVELPKRLPEVKREPSGALVFADKAGTARLRVPRPYAVDARGERRDATMEYEDGRLRVRLDASGLAYPVLLDPVVETVVWQQVVGPPIHRSNHALAYDSVRNRTVLFGGREWSSALADTWEWDGSTWTQRSQTGPSVRSGHAMAYDSARQRTVLFGGSNNAETWEWDGSTWSKRASTGPSALSFHAMAYDSARKRTVLFGGNSGMTTFGDTWEWDGSTWTLRSQTGPSPRNWSAMVYDSSRARTVLFGGSGNGGDVSDTWEWDGATWTQRGSTGPSPRHAHQMAYDSSRHRVVLFAGYNGGAGYLSDTWEWDGATWTQQPVSGASPRAWAAMVYDSARNRSVLFGGQGYPITVASDTWEWDGSTWTQRSPPAPSARTFHAMAYDKARGQTVLFGGRSGSNRLGDTWEWDGATWKQRASTGPAARTLHAMAYDSLRGRTVLFGGDVGTSDTWEWDGTTWTQRSSTGPVWNYGTAIAYDSARGRTVLFTGIDDGYGTSQTWEWDGTSWTQRDTAAASPWWRFGEGFAYDSARGRTVLAGGMDGNYNGYDVWEWDGTSWAQVGGGFSFTRSDTAMAYDSARGRTVLFGGQDSQGPFLADTEEWDGVQWTQRANEGPTARADHAMAYDSARGRIVLFGGGDAHGIELGDTWEYETRGGPCSCANGGNCASSACDSGYCVDGVCCEGVTSTNPPACAPCQDCETAKNPGVCTNVINTQDADSCTGSSACDATAACISKKPNGASSTADILCQSGFCTDGVCCAARCQGTCSTCAATAGSCTTVSGADDPDTCTGANTCDSSGACKLKNGQGCTDGTVCASSFCSDGFCCGDACKGGCDVCAASLGASADGTCTVLPASDVGQNPVCSPFVCNGASACPVTCTSDADCAASYYCESNGACLARKAKGLACDETGDCKTGGCRVCGSGFCVDNVCCDTACNTLCQACAAPLKQSGPDGTCGPAKDDTNPHSDTCPVDPPTSCGHDGKCDGTGACRLYYPPGTSCGMTMCSANNRATGTICDGVGICSNNPNGVLCDPYVCTDGSCPNSCASDVDCIATAYCRQGSCVPKATNGAPCTAPNVCASNICTDGVCCNSACQGQCAACDAENTEGTCTPIVGAPHGIRMPCSPGDPQDPCSAAQCDGISPASCNGHPGASVSCGTASCANAQAQALGACDGQGRCKMPPLSSCGTFACDALTCKTDCTTDTDCAKGNRCDTTTSKCISGSTCDGDHTVTDTNGSPTDCSPYKCQPNGTCLPRCNSVQDCVEPAVCDSSGTCAAAPAPGGDADSSGCGCRTSRAQTPLRQIAGWLIGVSALLARRRPRRRATNSFLS